MRAITATVVYDAAALNRGENIAGNITSVKKLTLPTGVHSFISRQAIRHYLLNTLASLYGWPGAEVQVMKSSDSEVTQFRIPKDCSSNKDWLMDNPELDVFGYMVTVASEKKKGSKGKERNENAQATEQTPGPETSKEVDTSENQTKGYALTRKAVLGITKCISLFNFKEDVVFYSNHDLVARAKLAGEQADPNPYSREEHQSLFKVSFVLDIHRLGVPDDSSSTEHFSETALNELADYRRKIAKDIFSAVANGLISQSSGEANSLVPIFMLMGMVKIPVAVFHPYITAFVSYNESERRFKPRLQGITHCLRNQYLRGENFESKVFYFCADNVVDVDLADTQGISFTHNLHEFFEVIRDRDDIWKGSVSGKALRASKGL